MGFDTASPPWRKQAITATAGEFPAEAVNASEITARRPPFPGDWGDELDFNETAFEQKRGVSSSIYPFNQRFVSL